MAQLRRKLEPDAGRPRYLITEPGMGYRFDLFVRPFSCPSCVGQLFGHCSQTRWLPLPAGLAVTASTKGW